MKRGIGETITFQGHHPFMIWFWLVVSNPNHDFTYTNRQLPKPTNNYPLLNMAMENPHLEYQLPSWELTHPFPTHVWVHDFHFPVRWDLLVPWRVMIQSSNSQHVMSIFVYRICYNCVSCFTLRAEICPALTASTVVFWWSVWPSVVKKKTCDGHVKKLKGP